VSVGLVGCGVWGLNILRDLLLLGHDVFVVDTDSMRRDIADRNRATGVFPDTAALPEVDGFIVATPASTHAEVIESVLGRDVPVFVEKPLTDDPESARRISRLAPERVFVMHIWMYHPGIEKLAEIARTRTLGEVNMLYTARTNWTSPRTDVDIVWTALPHDITIARSILGKVPEPLSSVAESIDGVTVGMVCMLGGPPYCVFNVSARFQDKRREVRLHCTGGVAVLPCGESSFIEIARGRKLEPDVERLKISTESALQRELRACMAYLEGGPAPRSGVAEGVWVVEQVARLRVLAGIGI
jgi:predicted dehydrogenase